MSAPSISSHTVGVSLPSFTITRDLGEKQTVVSSRLTSAAVRQTTKSSVKREKRSIGAEIARMLPYFLMAVTASMFVWYLYSVNSLEGLSYTLQTVQKEVGVKQDQQRQFQVRIAESSAHIRMQEQAGEAKGFVSIGTPEFVSGSATTSALTMR